MLRVNPGLRKPTNIGIWIRGGLTTTNELENLVLCGVRPGRTSSWWPRRSCHNAGASILLTMLSFFSAQKERGIGSREASGNPMLNRFVCLQESRSTIVSVNS